MLDNETFSKALPHIGVDSPWLAPLAGFSDLPFRLLCQEQGAKVTCTEMVSAKGLIYGLRQHKGQEQSAGLKPVAVNFSEAFAGKNSPPPYGDLLVSSANATEDLLTTVAGEKNLVVQLFGAEAEFLGNAVSYLKTLGFSWFDLNMGCSVPKVTKTGAGSCMLRDLPNAVQVVKAMVDAGGIVGCKIRLGWQKDDYLYLDLAKALEDAGASWITLHPRFAKQGFAGVVEKEPLAKLARAVSLPVMASGDLFLAEDGVDRIQNYGVKGVMFARGAMENPFIFRQYHALLAGKTPHQPSKQELYELVLRHATLASAYTPGKAGRKGFAPALLKMRTVVPRYLKNFANVKLLRQELGQCASWEDFYTLIHNFFGKASAEEEI